ncbi:alpha-ketoglutarate-dependent dioxygenase AlkB [Sphingomonas oligophenolica]|uniref:Alpha-ketoglutarate-dependent dioxygenase AlkB n=1 Tax=Sphingomonas oligophenolica TaxID=301154 RepID=A0A502C2Y8_9SPHN|nr:alpha-ketoglutarate-dependent dioxygenase AlkB [Sphingomonas oligophenolica]TPG07517.1 alpha-ketoglutarate-dependent dioxygenase AlkB [Sphingomonas oligophenolica]
MTDGNADLTDLIGESRLPGFDTRTDVVSRVEEIGLIERIDATDPEPFRFQGWLGKRLTTSYGIGYDFDAARLELAEPMPDWLMPVRVRAAKFTGLDPKDLTQALLIRYDPGAGIGWHRDRPYYEHVIGISLGAPATLRLRRRVAKGFDRLNMPLAPRSIYHLSGEARHVWEHSIAAMDDTRWSITFRSLSSSGLAALRRTSPTIPVQR